MAFILLVTRAFKKDLFIFISMGKYLRQIDAYVYKKMHAAHMETREDERSSGAGVIGDCEPPCGCRELNKGSL